MRLIVVRVWAAKSYEKIKDQGSFLNTMKQVAGVFEGAAQFKRVSDAKDKEEDGFNLVKGFGNQVKNEVVEEFNSNEQQLERERTEATVELKKEADTQEGPDKVVTNEAVWAVST